MCLFISNQHSQTQWPQRPTDGDITMEPLMLGQPLIPIVLLCSVEMSLSVAGWWIIKEVFVHKYWATPFTNTRLLCPTMDNTLSNWATLNVGVEWWALIKLFTENHLNWLRRQFPSLSWELVKIITVKIQINFVFCYMLHMVNVSWVDVW